MSLLAYSFFHLNLAYSAIEEEARAQVVERCYWPILRLAKRLDLPFGIELSGYSLAAIARIDPDWVDELAVLVREGSCELIGCGYAQVIGPLVPAEVTAANLRIGNAIYEEALGVRPTIALLNEQTYSAGIVPLYREAGYTAVIMEWNNPARVHPEWSSERRYYPQFVRAQDGSEVPVIWNKSIAFQKVQRYAHGELQLDEVLAYVRGHRGSRPRAFPLYGNDVEVFDYRPGRYMTEAPVQTDGEWRRLEALFEALTQEPSVNFIAPSNVLELMQDPDAGHVLQLESAPQPIPVKKQDKYNPVRWAVSGRGDLEVNTLCWQAFEAIRTSPDSPESDWKELCYLWSSDFRTHITEKRWSAYRQRLADFRDRWNKQRITHGRSGVNWPVVPVETPPLSERVYRDERFVSVFGKRLQVRFNCYRGLAVESFIDRSVAERALFGTIQHGYFDDIGLGADFYSGGIVVESPGQPKITDLDRVEPEVIQYGDLVRLRTIIQTPLGPIEKTWTIDDAEGKLYLKLTLDWADPFLGSVRLGHVTLNPGTFDDRLLIYRAHNGGRELETFPIRREVAFDHGRAVSFLVSANQCVGVTQGVAEIGDRHQCVRVEFDKSQTALVGLVNHQVAAPAHFTRLCFSAREVDDTAKPAPLRDFNAEFVYSGALAAGQ